MSTVQRSDAQVLIHERALGAGTTMRFVLLIVLMLVASASTALSVRDDLYRYAQTSCQLAAGVDPSSTSVSSSIVPLGEQGAYHACLAVYAHVPQWWLPLLWPVVVILLAAALASWVPLWRARPRRAVALAEVDPTGELRRTVSTLALRAGLSRLPSVVVNPTATTTDASVFGRTGRPIVRLHGGLLAQRVISPGGFEAVLLHEFAHIRNRDVTLAHATIALWRVFLLVVALPYSALQVYVFLADSAAWSLDSADDGPRQIASVALMVVLVYLVRGDVLRSREAYADLAAVRAGADPRQWSTARQDLAPGRLRRTLGAFAELWRPHPRRDLRAAVLADPGRLHGARALPMFATGALAAFLYSQAWYYLKTYGFTGNGVLWAVDLSAAGLVAAIAGVMLWRAVAHAVVTGGPVPTGMREGAWLGTGFALSDLITGQEVVGGWLPGQPEFLLLLVCAGVVFSCWTTQCALLWARSWPGGGIRLAMVPTLFAAGLGMACWFAWWQGGGELLAAGWPLDTSPLRQGIEQAFPGHGDGHALVIRAFLEVIPVIASVERGPLLGAGITALWTVPLLAWSMRPGSGTPRWVLGALRDPGDLVALSWAEPADQQRGSVRRLLLPGLLGTGLGTGMALGAYAYAHTLRPSPLVGGNYLIYLALIYAVAVASAACAAAFGAALCAHRYRLVATLIAAETAALGGLGVVFLLGSTNGGCLPALSLDRTGCGWRPGPIWQAFSVVLAPVLMSALVLAGLTAAVVSLVRKRPDRGQRPCRDRSTLPPSRACRRSLRVLLALGCAAALALSAPLTDQVADGGHLSTSSVTSIDLREAGPPVPSAIRRAQSRAWLAYGGQRLLNRFLADMQQVASTASQPPTVVAATAGPLCAELGALDQQADGYFTVPDPASQQLWPVFIAQLGNAARSCVQYTARRETSLFAAALQWAVESTQIAEAIQIRLDEVTEQGSAVATTPVVVHYQTVPVTAWNEEGAQSLLVTFGSEWQDLSMYVSAAHGQLMTTSVLPYCGQLSKLGQDVSAYFPVSDAVTQRLWLAFAGQVAQGGTQCTQAMTQVSSSLFEQSRSSFAQASLTAADIESRLAELGTRGAGG
ncbi:M48 family metalloprotease [Streptacidiphilus albus]|uniref:M48 family metalloprotease n=1 Tax=Streptacidiphilus albus TaxID=105425 RepID=UPI00054B99BA|nr:M48 family metalloprotease [Streptacidiphilus albus]